MKKLPVFFILIVFSVISLQAQDTTQVQKPPEPQKQKQPMGRRIYFGGNAFFSVGSYTRIGVEPLVGFKLTPKLSAGIKISYEYVKDKRFDDTYETSNYGGSLFARYRIIPPLYFHADYTMINYDLYNSAGESSRTWVPFLFIGGGYSQRMGSHAWLNFQVLFDVLQNENSPYRPWEPFFSVGVGVGF